MNTLLAPLALFLLAGAASAPVSIPAGTVLPVLLESSISTRHSKPGQIVKARIMQDVPLGSGTKIRSGAYVEGQVISVTPATARSAAQISFRFDRIVISKRSIPIATSLRAVASPLEIDGAQTPLYGGDRGTPSIAYETTQVGGEVVYRGGGHVMDGYTVVGEPVYDGVLSRARANPDRNCRGTIDGNDRPQALWLFSSDACGTYDYDRVKIVHAGRSNPAGEISLTSDRGEINIRAGSGMLLRVLQPSGEKDSSS